MISFITGVIYEVSHDYIIIENNGIGYHLTMGQTTKFSVGSDVLVHTYQHVREDEISLFGFSDTTEREVFLLLIKVKGIGPKTANNILAKATAFELINAIGTNDVKFLRTLPGIGAKSAQQIILDLQNKLEFESVEKNVNSDLEDALLALKSLGYNNSDLKYVRKELDLKVMNTDEYLKAALKLINQRKGA